MTKVTLGFTVPEGKPKEITLHHTVVTGMTDLSGKTTTVEALLRRSNAKALVYLTKRGEKTFRDARRIQPFYKERFDWEYVLDLLEACRKEKLKFERAWIIRVAKRSTDLADFHKNLKELLKTEKKLRGIDRNVYTVLDAYLDKVMPVLKRAKKRFTDKLELQQGLNVMDLTPWYTNEEVQMLVIRSSMEWILQNENDVVDTLPEAWKMLPQFRSTPVKQYFEKFIREGATNRNFLVIDAQDLGGVDKTPLRQVSMWIMGKMMEANEVARILKQTLGLDVKVEDVQTLKLGHFIVADGITNTVEEVYVWPHGVPREVAEKVARGELTPQHVRDKYLKPKKEDEDLVYKEKFEEERRIREKFEKTLGEYSEELKRLRKKLAEKKSPEEIDELRKTIMKLKDEKAQWENQARSSMNIAIELRKEIEPLKNLRDALVAIMPTPTPAHTPMDTPISIPTAVIDERINQRLSESKSITVVKVDVDQRIKELVKNSYVQSLEAKIKALPQPAVKAALWMHEKKQAKISDLYYYMYEKSGRIPGNFYANVVNPLQDAWLIVNEAGNVRWILEEKLSEELKDVLRNGDVQDLAKYLTSLLL